VTGWIRQGRTSSTYFSGDFSEHLLRQPIRERFRLLRAALLWDAGYLSRFPWLLRIRVMRDFLGHALPIFWRVGILKRLP
jgi:hypothetical protein